MYIAVCTANITRGNPHGSPQCLQDVGCVFYDEKVNKCVAYSNTPHAELRLKFTDYDSCEKKCAT